MPNSYGHAKDFFEKTLADGQKNNQRNLTQYQNSSETKPKVNDLLIFDGSVFNKYGHVAIISNVTNNEVEIIQQNTGRKSRQTFTLDNQDRKWKIKSKLVLGWLRKD
jgi:surface antigen